VPVLLLQRRICTSRRGVAMIVPVGMLATVIATRHLEATAVVVPFAVLVTERTLLLTIK